jgi:hypothetical protein
MHFVADGSTNADAAEIGFARAGPAVAPAEPAANTRPALMTAVQRTHATRQAGGRTCEADSDTAGPFRSDNLTRD